MKKSGDRSTSSQKRSRCPSRHNGRCPPLRDDDPRNDLEQEIRMRVYLIYIPSVFVYGISRILLMMLAMILFVLSLGWSMFRLLLLL